MGQTFAFEEGAPAEQGWQAYPARGGGFESHVGPFFWRRGQNGLMEFAFRCLPQHTNPNGVVHGGMLMTFIDHVLGGLVWYKVGKKHCATVSLNCDFVASAKVGDWVHGEAKIVRQGRSLVFVRGELRVDERAILSATGIWKVIGVS